MGGIQLGFSDYELTTAIKQTKREKLLSEKVVVVPWQALLGPIEPHYPKGCMKGDWPPYPLATMLDVDGVYRWRLLVRPGRATTETL